MDKMVSKFKLKVLKNKTLFIVLTLVVTILHVQLNYEHIRDSSRSDSADINI